MNEIIGLKKFASNSFYNFVRQGLTLALGLLSSIFLARGLGPDGRGIYALALLLPTLVLTLTRLGVDSSTVYYLARKEYDERTIIGSNILLSLALSLFSLLIGYLLIIFAGSVLFAGVTLPVLAMAMALIPLMMLRINLLNVLLGAQEFRAYNAAGLIPEVTRLVLTIALLWWLKWGVNGGLLASIGAELVGSLALLVIYQRRLKNLGQGLALAWDSRYIRSALQYGAKTYVGTVVNFLNYRSDKFLVNMFSGTVAVGAYDISVSVAERLWLISQAVSSVLFPKVASMENAEEERLTLTLLVARNILWSTILFSLILVPLADFVVVLMYGEEFQSSGMGLKLLLPGIISLGFARILANDIAGRGKPEINAIHTLIGFGINLVSNIILIPRLGFFGASISSSISYTATAVMKVISYRDLTGASIKSIILPTHEDVRLFVKLFRVIVFEIKAKIKPVPKKVKIG
jgi:O-antigen/teichoic acid export membrane protein